jgi:alpha-aminoadipic semialdehyde synthase
MPALDKILSSNIRLIDYEKIIDEKNNRLIAFGKYAGIAGAIDFLKGFGEYIMQMGINTPFLHCNCSYKYFDIKEAYNHLKQIGEKIKEKELPKELAPMIFAITGRGRSAQGCLEVLKNLPIT